MEDYRLIMSSVLCKLNQFVAPGKDKILKGAAPSFVTHLLSSSVCLHIDIETKTVNTNGNVS